MLARRGADSDLHLILAAELTARGWDIAQFARELGAKYGVVSRWLDQNPRKRVVPQPWTCVEIATLLQLDVIDVFKHAGYLPMTDPQPPGPHRARIEALKRRLDRTLDRVSDERQWLLASAITEMMLDQLQLILDRIEPPV